MRLIDHGPDRVLLYPEVEQRDDYGTPIRAAGTEPIELWVHLQRASTDELQVLGQESRTVKTFRTSRRLPPTAWAKVEAEGRTWQVEGEPSVQGRTARTRHTLVTISTDAAPVAQASDPRE